MSHTVSGKITRAPKIQSGNNSKGPFTAFFFEISEFNKGFGQEEDSYTNYSVAFFPKSQGAIDFHMKAIQEGSFVVVQCDKLKLDISNIEYPKVKMENPRLENFFNANQGQQQAPQQQMQQQPAPQMQQQQMAPQQQAPAYQPQQAPVQQMPAYQQPPQHAPQLTQAQQRANAVPQQASPDSIAQQVAAGFQDDQPPF